MLIKGVGKNEMSENGIFLQKMLHKRLGGQDLCKYSLDFTSENIKIFQIACFLADRENFD